MGNCKVKHDGVDWTVWTGPEYGANCKKFERREA